MHLVEELGESDDLAGAVEPLHEYATDPVRFASEVLGITLWGEQIRICRSVVENPRTAVVAAHGVGKTMVAAVLAEWRFSCCGAPVITSAPSGRQVRELLWRQIRINRSRAKKPLPGRLMTTAISVEGRPEWYSYGFATDDPNRAQGAHDERLMVILDEASGIPLWLWEVIEGMISSGECRLLAIGNPSSARGQFYRYFHEERDTVAHFTISALECPNVIAGKTVIPGLTGRDWVEDKKRRWGEESALYRMRVLGKFPKEDEEKAIPLDWITQAQQLWTAIDAWNACGRVVSLELLYRGEIDPLTLQAVTEPLDPEPELDPAEGLDDPGPIGDDTGEDLPEEYDGQFDDEPDPELLDEEEYDPDAYGDEEEYDGSDAPPADDEPERLTKIGLDVAGPGPDKSAMVELRGQRVHIAGHWREPNTMKTVERVMAHMLGLDEKPEQLIVDSNAIGRGVCDRIEELLEEAEERGDLRLVDVELVRLDWGSGSSRPDESLTRLDELYWRLREALNPERPIRERLALPPSDVVAAQLNVRKFSLDERRRVRIETKKMLKKRGAPSPDLADAIAALMYTGDGKRQEIVLA